MITQCTIRHLFAIQTTPANPSPADQPPPPSKPADPSAPVPPATKTALLALARTFTLARCSHHTLPEPLTTLDCHRAVVDAADGGANRHRYCLAAQDETLRAWARARGRAVPMVYVRRSVMIMEPMAAGGRGVREGVERRKIREGVERVRPGAKRKRGDGEGEADEAESQKKKKKTKGPREPNPLSAKKKKAKAPTQQEGNEAAEQEGYQEDQGVVQQRRVEIDKLPAKEVTVDNALSEGAEKRKRKRKHKGGVPRGMVKERIVDGDAEGLDIRAA